MTLERRTPLKRTEFKRRPAKPREPKPSKPSRAGVNFTEKVKARVRLRAHGCCEAGLAGCTGAIEQFHHRLMKSQGGKGTLSNALGVCHRCHAAIHANPKWAYLHGLLVRSHHEPHEVKPFAGCGLACRENHTFPSFDIQPSRP